MKGLIMFGKSKQHPIDGNKTIANALESFTKVQDSLQEGIDQCAEANKKIETEMKELETKKETNSDSIEKANKIKDNISKMLGL